MNDIDEIQSPLDKAIAAAEAAAKRFTLLKASKLHDLPALSWLVYPLLPMMGLACIFGPSGSGKSFLLIHLVAAIAEGADWFSRKTQACRVLILVLEGKGGFLQRIQAWEAQNGRPYPDNVTFIFDDFGLNSGTDVIDLQTVIQDAGGFDMIVIDTLARAAPNADENSSYHMSQIISAAGKLQAAISGLVVLVHPTGKDDSRGMRGHSSLFAAMDACIEVRRVDVDRAWRLVKSKDGQDGIEQSFKLTVVELGETEAGPVSSCVIEPTDEGSSAFESGSEVRPKTPNQLAVRTRIGLMLATATATGQGGAPPDTPCILITDLLAQVKDEITGGPRHQGERAKEALDWLVKNQLVNRGGEWLWMTVIPAVSA